MQYGNQEPNYAKLMQIYEAFDARNHRHALKLIQQTMAKFPHSYILKSLRCLALYRTDRRLEALHHLKEVLAVPHTEEAVLNAVAMILKAEEDWQALANMYSMASAAHPNSKGLAEQVFFSAVRYGVIGVNPRSGTGTGRGPLRL